MNEFTIRIICLSEAKEIVEKKKELIDLLAEGGWFKVIESSGEESAGVYDIILIGFDKSIIFARVFGEEIREKYVGELALRIHNIFFNKWLNSRRARKQEVEKNEA